MQEYLISNTTVVKRDETDDSLIKSVVENVGRMLERKINAVNVSFFYVFGFVLRKTKYTYLYRLFIAVHYEKGRRSGGGIDIRSREVANRI